MIPKLTKREQEILNWVAQGLTNKQVAQRLKISESTIKMHMGSILKKYGVKSRSALTASAITHNTTTFTPVTLEEKPYAWVKHHKGFSGIAFNMPPDDTWTPVYRKA